MIDDRRGYRAVEPSCAGIRLEDIAGLEPSENGVSSPSRAAFPALALSMHIKSESCSPIQVTRTCENE